MWPEGGESRLPAALFAQAATLFDVGDQSRPRAGHLLPRGRPCVGLIAPGPRTMRARTHGRLAPVPGSRSPGVACVHFTVVRQRAPKRFTLAADFKKSAGVAVKPDSSVDRRADGGS
jgi:hypothetical protein